MCNIGLIAALIASTSIALIGAIVVFGVAAVNAGTFWGAIGNSMAWALLSRSRAHSPEVIPVRSKRSLPVSRAGIFLHKAHRAFSGTGAAWMMRWVGLAVMLACPVSVYAQPCNFNATLSASPASIDLRTSPDAVSILTWSVNPKKCSGEISLTLADKPVDLSGSTEVRVERTTIFKLRVTSLPNHPAVASTTVTVSGGPGFITVSKGRQITPEDIAQFDAKWMLPYQQAEAIARAEGNLYRRNDRIAWEVGERMDAMARMYELTHDRRYLNHLRQIIGCALEDRNQCALEYRDGPVLRFRDDRHPGGERYPPCPPCARDEIRNANGLPAWGGRSVNSGGLHRVDEVVSSLYAYPIAAFARIVAEDASLHAAYGNDAVHYANVVIETVWTFIPQIRYRNAGSFVEAWIATHDNYRTKPTTKNCEDAYEQALKVDPGAPNGDMLKGCKELRVAAGSPLAHNENLAFAMVLIELSRALDSAFYRQSPARSQDAEPTRALIPLLVSRQHRYFMNRVQNPGNPRFWWHYSDDLPPGIEYHAEDTSHGALDMRYLDLLRRNFDRLNVVPTSVGEPIPLNSTHLRAFANTFLQRIAVGRHFKDDVDGDTADPIDRQNGNCDGWMNLAIADVNVYHRCHEMSLRIVNGQQPYLSIGNHSALLMNKRLLPAPPPCPTGRKCCEPAPDGGCARCVPRAAQCP